MVKSQVEKKVTLDFPMMDWETIVTNVVVSCNLNETEQALVCNAPVAKLLAALPYYVGCKNPDQLAVLKVGMYVAGLRNPALYAHRDNQTVRERIEPGTMCPSGDPEVVEIVTSFLELISLNDHINDFEDDMRTGHPNPVGTNMLFSYARREQLIYLIEKVYNQEVVQRLMETVNPLIVDFWDGV
jgi:hypothetical protein